MINPEYAAKILWRLLALLVSAMFVAEVFFRTDGTFFTSVSQMASSVLGALLMLLTGQNIVKSKDGSISIETPTSSSKVTTHEEAPLINGSPLSAPTAPENTPK